MKSKLNNKIYKIMKVKKIQVSWVKNNKKKSSKRTKVKMISQIDFDICNNNKPVLKNHAICLSVSVPY